MGVTARYAGVSGPTPQLGKPELLGQASTADVPVNGKLADAGARENEHPLPPEVVVVATSVADTWPPNVSVAEVDSVPPTLCGTIPFTAKLVEPPAGTRE